MRSTLLLACLLLASLSTPVQAQRGPIRDVLRVRRLSSPQDNLYPPLAANEIGRSNVNGMSGARPAVLLTGYWPPTNEMLREFSDDLGQNPGGWIGSDWEGRGYDVYAYFPEFSPANCWNCGAGTGDLTVDYQDTSSDFWPIVNNLQPIAIITFSRGFPDVSWEVEMNQFNRSQWIDDYVPPVQPTPAPPDATVPPGTNRPSTLPVQAIVDAVAAANLGLSPSICFTGNGGGFLSEFMAYHGVWYQAEHADPLDSAWCVAAGHVHVGGLIPWPTAKDAAKVTIRTVLSYVDGIVGCDGFTNYCQAAPNSTGSGSTINAAGSASIAFNSLTFKLQGGPPHEALPPVLRALPATDPLRRRVPVRRRIAAATPAPRHLRWQRRDHLPAGLQLAPARPGTRRGEPRGHLELPGLVSRPRRERSGLQPDRRGQGRVLPVVPQGTA